MWVPLSEVDSLLTYESDRELAEQVRTAQNPRPPAGAPLEREKAGQLPLLSGF